MTNEQKTQTKKQKTSGAEETLHVAPPNFRKRRRVRIEREEQKEEEAKR